MLEIVAEQPLTDRVNHLNTTDQTRMAQVTAKAEYESQGPIPIETEPSVLIKEATSQLEVRESVVDKIMAEKDHSVTVPKTAQTERSKKTDEKGDKKGPSSSNRSANGPAILPQNLPNSQERQTHHGSFMGGKSSISKEDEAAVLR